VPTAVPTFFVASNNLQTGPFDFATVTGKVRDGSLTRTTLVWKAGMPSWSAAESVDELKPLFGAAPPTLPK
jgi:GYF domain 2